MSASIACIVNAHREGQTIYPTLRSVERARDYASSCGLQTEVLIILDRGDDQTLEFVKREEGKDVRLIEVEFGDLAHSRNHAVSLTDAEYCSFLDGDDLWCKSWLVDCMAMAPKQTGECVLHPEYNVVFGCDYPHVFHHVDMLDTDFEIESLYYMNYWTALSFSKTAIYRKYAYLENMISDGFGFEDWTWNHETISNGVLHRVVPGTSHYIRKGRDAESLSALTSKMNAVPRIHDIYRRKGEAALRKVA